MGIFSTVIVIAVFMCNTIIGNPRIYLDKIGHKTGYLAFHDGRISPNYVLVFGLGHIKLRYNCQQKKQQKLP